MLRSLRWAFSSKKPLKCLLIAGFVQQNGFTGVYVHLTEVSAKCKIFYFTVNVGRKQSII